MFNAIKQTCQNYYDQIPPDSLPIIGKSALFSFTFALLLVDRNKPYDIVQPLVKGGTAALAACIYSLTTPIFNMMFGDNRHLFHREILKVLVINVLTALACLPLTTGKVALTALPVLRILSWHIVLSMLDIYPTVFDYIDPPLANWMRRSFATVGITLVPGSASLQFVI